MFTSSTIVSSFSSTFSSWWTLSCQAYSPINWGNTYRPSLPCQNEHLHCVWGLHVFVFVCLYFMGVLTFYYRPVWMSDHYCEEWPAGNLSYFMISWGVVMATNLLWNASINIWVWVWGGYAKVVVGMWCSGSQSSLQLWSLSRLTQCYISDAGLH